MIAALRRRLAARGGEAGLTLVELLIAAAMSVVIVGAACMMLISAVRGQPKLSQKDQAITTARYVLERMTREIRNGVAVYDEPAPTGSEVSFQTQSCSELVKCRVTYRCTTTECTRTETEPEATSGGTPTTIVSGLDSNQVFNYEPNTEEPVFIGITLHIANPEGDGDLTITDGAGLRTLDYASN